MSENNKVSLSSSECYISHNETEAYRVLSGRILVFIAPEKEWGEGRKSFIYEAGSGEIIPSFFYTDRESVSWRFCLTAYEDSEIEIIEYGSTKILKEKFSEKIKMKNYRQEGYDSGLIEQYKENILKEDILIRRNRNLKSNTFSDVLESIAGSFSKKKIKVDTELTKNSLYDSVNLICAKSKIPIASIEKIKEACGEDFNLADIARISHFSYRKITLSADWNKNDSGAFVVFSPDKKPLACIPGKLKASGAASYVLFDPETGSVTPVANSIAANISPTAYMIYKPLPAKELGKKDLFAFCKSSVSAQDILTFLILVVITAVLGLIIPMVNEKLIDEFIPHGEKDDLVKILFLLLSFMLANAMIAIVKNLTNFRISSKVTYSVGNAVFDRIFNLPESFFREYESADLTKRAMSVSSTVNSIVTVIVSGSISLVFMLIYVIRMFSYSVRLTVTSLFMVFIYGLVYYFINRLSVKYSEQTAELESKTGSKLFQYLNGISKIRIAGVEDRAIFEYMNPYIKLRERYSRSGKLSLVNIAISTAAGTLFTVVFYLIVVKSTGFEISTGKFVAFTSLFGVFEAYALESVSNLVSLRALTPTYRRFEPILKEKPEFDVGCDLPGDLTGEIEINNVSFSYSDDEPEVLRDINLTINQGDYIGIVGPSGSGKSTLTKLLLGFEKPTAGKIYYDNKDIESLDKRELRKKMGVVLQNGKLISGSIFDNITITAPDATAEDVNKVIQAVGLRDDIDKMPMGIYTMLNEESNTISGGQMQRILIARAIISSPKILIFDEATSALDNITQNLVSETLDKMNVTRIVIAHRLSTIMKCNRIIVLDSGRIAEEGTYEELMSKGGIFNELASRQIS